MSRYYASEILSNGSPINGVLEPIERACKAQTLRAQFGGKRPIPWPCSVANHPLFSHLANIIMKAFGHGERQSEPQGVRVHSAFMTNTAPVLTGKFCKFCFSSWVLFFEPSIFRATIRSSELTRRRHCSALVAFGWEFVTRILGV